MVVAIAVAVRPVLRRKLYDQRDEQRDLQRRVEDKLITWALHTFPNICYKPLIKNLGRKKERGCAIHDDATHAAWEAYLAQRDGRHHHMDNVRALRVSVYDPRPQNPLARFLLSCGVLECVCFQNLAS